MARAAPRVVQAVCRFFGSTYRRLAGVIAGSRHARQRKCRSRLPAGASICRRTASTRSGSRLRKAGPKPEGSSFTFITVGRLVPVQGSRLDRRGDGWLRIASPLQPRRGGDGPQGRALERQVRRNGLEDNVRIAGWVESAQIGERALGSAQAFVFPSLREFGGGIVLEALATGLPAIVVDYGGPGELVTPECGELLPMRPRAELTPALPAAVDGGLGATDPEPLSGHGGGQPVAACENYTWDVKAEPHRGEMARETLEKMTRRRWWLKDGLRPRVLGREGRCSGRGT